MQDTIANTVRTYDSSTLRHARRTIEAEQIAACKRGDQMTQAHVGQHELLAAIGAELDERGELLEPPPYVEVCWESMEGRPVRLSFMIRVW